jgi:phosphoglycolate phosphatase
MFNNINAVIIDLDGTMLDTAPDFLVAINRMRNDFSLTPITLDMVKSMVGKGSENLITRVLSLDFDEAGVQQHFAQGMASYQRHYLDINGDHSTLYPEVIEGLQAMQAMRLRLACVTNKPLAFAIPLMQKKGLSSYFELTFGGDSFARKKPDPQPLLEVSKQFGLRHHIFWPSATPAMTPSRRAQQVARYSQCLMVTTTARLYKRFKVMV